MVADDGDHHGVPVIEASRLEAMARPGEILATDVVRVLGHRRSNVSFEEVGETTLKGLDHPVLVHRVVELSSGAAPAFPRILVSDAALPLVGRGPHVDLFRSRWNEAKAGTGGLILVGGQPGIGKTRLISHCAGLAHEDGAIILAGGARAISACHTSRSRWPYATWPGSIRRSISRSAAAPVRWSDCSRAALRVTANPSRRRHASSCSTPWWPSSADSRSCNRYCSSSTICTGRPSRRYSCSAISCRRSRPSGCSSSPCTARNASTRRIRCASCSPTSGRPRRRRR